MAINVIEVLWVIMYQLFTTGWG